LRDLRVGDLVCLSAEDWSDAWRFQMGIVLCDYDSRRVKSHQTGKFITLRRWKALIADQGIVTVIKDDVTLIQGAGNELS
jgi:hypothetical protein